MNQAYIDAARTLQQCTFGVYPNVTLMTSFNQEALKTGSLNKHLFLLHLGLLTLNKMS